MAVSDPFELKRPHAALTWGEGGPVSDAIGDVYFSAENGLEETRAVFLAGAGFPARFNKDLTVVGELGFGTGLNFLALAHLFLAAAPVGSRLHFITVEGWPLRQADAAKALSAFPELRDLAASLLKAWPSPHKGAHRRIFAEGRITLTVFHDLSEPALANMAFQADAWFMDGFSPAKNPDMWTPALFGHVARLSKQGAPAATFTVAGHVRRGLAEAGFAVEKRPGFGRKRERLEAIFKGRTDSAAPSGFHGAAPAPAQGSIAIIGGGIAAACLVEAFKRRGRAPTVFAKGGWASGASGAPLGLLTPRLEAADRPHNRALLAAFDYAAALYGNAGWLKADGVLRCADAAPGRARLEALATALDDCYAWIEPAMARDKTGSASDAGLWISAAGSFKPEQIVQGLAGELAAVDADIAAITRHPDGLWRLESAAGEHYGLFETVIQAGGYDASALSAVPLEATAGRVAGFQSPGGLTAPIAWGGYAAPMQTDEVLVGATHVKGDQAGDEHSAEKALRDSLADGPLELQLGSQLRSWSGVRAATADRLPVCGPMPDDTFSERWRAAARRGLVPGRGADVSADGLCGPLILSGFGARGFAHAPLLAEALVSAICGEPCALEADGLQALHPARFAWRALRRGA